ncbi:hypothetical protein ALC57_09783 [Trachymyrmex cornetzi]|uniref:Uncharacterized protein n=1 Tax=Trachymyrmex cornetzi TaxID=471704 RepID=A0A195DYI8_9HYME|nr:hypothetical protein ALC57_09783 [Trachymyrmex cornetzi]
MAEASRLPEVAKEMKCLPAGEAALPTPVSSEVASNLPSSTRKRGKGLERRSFALISKDTKIKRRGSTLRATRKSIRNTYYKTYYSAIRTQNQRRIGV